MRESHLAPLNYRLSISPHDLLPFSEQNRRHSSHAVLSRQSSDDTRWQPWGEGTQLLSDEREASRYLGSNGLLGCPAKFIQKTSCHPPRASTHSVQKPCLNPTSSNRFSCTCQRIKLDRKQSEFFTYQLCKGTPDFVGYFYDYKCSRCFMRKFNFF